jgi:ketosteroid isomerase-like protein
VSSPAGDQHKRDTADWVSQNVEIVLGQFEAVNARDFAAAMDAYAEDVALVVHGSLGEMVGRAATGKRAVGDWFGEWFRHFAADYRFQVEEARESGDQVFLVASHGGHGRTSGAPVEGRTGYLYTVRAGRICRVELFSDPDEAVEAVEFRE